MSFNASISFSCSMKGSRHHIRSGRRSSDGLGLHVQKCNYVLQLVASQITCYIRPTVHCMWGLHYHPFNYLYVLTAGLATYTYSVAYIAAVTSIMSGAAVNNT